jgi:hypothetical protein
MLVPVEIARLLSAAVEGHGFFLSRQRQRFSRRVWRNV